MVAAMANARMSRVQPHGRPRLRTGGALAVVLVFACTASCRRAPPPKIGWLAASDSDPDEPQPVESVYQPLPPMDIGILRDEEEGPCPEGPVGQLRDATTALGRLWLLDRDGRLWSFDRALEHRQGHLADRAVHVIRRAADGSLWAVVNEANRWRVLRRDASGWGHLGDLPEAAGALGEREGRLVFATREWKTFWFDAAGLMHVWTAPPGPPWQHNGDTSVAVTSDGSIYVGRDAGEFGGSLERIDVGGPGRRTTQEEVYGGPITGVVVDPTDRRCVVASHGLAHGWESGRVVRSCPGNVSVILEEELSPTRRGTRETLAFYQLVTNGGTVYAIAESETYAITGRAARQLAPPIFAERCGLTIAQVEALTFVRDPWMAKRYPREVIGSTRFVMPAL